MSQTDEERELVALEASCAAHVSRIRLEPSETPGNCSSGPKYVLITIFNNNIPVSFCMVKD